MSSVDFNNIKSYINCSLGSFPKIVDKFFDFIDRQFSWQSIFFRPGKRTWSNRSPSSIFRNNSMLESLVLEVLVLRISGTDSKERSRSAGFSSSMCKLNTSSSFVQVNEGYDSLKLFFLRILPQSSIIWRNSSFGRYSSGFCEYQTSTTSCKRSQMNQMPIIEESVLTRVLAHWRNHSSVLQCQVSNFVGSKQNWDMFAMIISDDRCWSIVNSFPQWSLLVGKFRNRGI
mmetsp:Transcript_2863/g.3804  ORF Transcript_2863/g.3804 Transcript_2863/m.3804 type:complete len:229 (+) Transcript_2863:558-1244(+)